MRCSRCGSELHTGETVCPGCGAEVRRVTQIFDDNTQTGPGSGDMGKPMAGNVEDDPGVIRGDSDIFTDDGFTQAPGFGDVDVIIDPLPPDKKPKWPIILGICAVVLVILAVIGYLFFYQDLFNEEDAKALVKAEMDSYVLGQYDEGFEFGNITREEAVNNRKEMIQNWVDVKQEEELFSDSLRDRTAEMWDQAFRKTNYSIGKAEEQEDSSFLVRVEIRPLDLYQGCDGSFYGKISERLRVESPEVFEDDSDLTPLYDAWWNGTLDQIMNVNLANPSYRTVEYNTVRVYQGDDAWYANSDDITAVEDKLFYYGSRWDEMVQN